MAEMADPVVKLQSGFARGVVEKHEDGFDYYAFRGIPYAEPPIGELRFKDPIPKKSWEEIMDCKSYMPMCLQHNLLSRAISYNEDCLHLNIFTRTIKETTLNHPVIVVIHGGAFYFGSGDDMFFGPEYLIRKDIVLVTVNYRLGVLGFLNLEDEVAPGNQGLKDLIMALQWIQQNIRVFGGDPDNVTVFGPGSGGAATHYLALSPLAKGLIHQVISQGSTMFNAWVSVDNPKLNAIKLCSLLGRELTDSREIFEFLKTTDAESLQIAQEKLRVLLDCIPFCIEIKHELDAANQTIQLPCLMGYNAHEAIVLLSGITRHDLFRNCNADFSYFLKYNTRKILDRYDVTPAQIKRLYFQNEAMSDENLEKYIECATDIYFTVGIHNLARVQAEHNSLSTYLYVFRYESSVSFAKVMLKDVPSGACHLDDLPFLFKMRFFEQFGLPYFQKGTEEYKLMEQMTELWTNFARYGRPTIDNSDLIPVQWEPIDDGTVLRYLNIDKELTMQTMVNLDQKILSAKSIVI